MKSGLTVILLLLLSLSCFGQQEVHSAKSRETDSLRFYLQQCQKGRDMDTVPLQKAMSYIHSLPLHSATISNIEDQFRQINRTKYPETYTTLYIDFLVWITRSDSLELAIRYCDEIIRNYYDHQNPDDRNIALNALLEIRKPLRTKDLGVAFQYYTTKLSDFLEVGDSSAVSLCYFCLGSNYRLSGLPDMSIYNFKKALSYLDKNDSLTTDPVCGLSGYMNHTSVLGQMYLQIEDYPKAIEYSREGRQLKMQLHDPNISFVNCNIALAKLMMNDLDSVYELLNESIPMALADGDYPSVVRIHEIKGRYFLAIGQLDSAENSLNRCKEDMITYSVNHFSPAGLHIPNYYLAQIRLLQNKPEEARAFLESEIPRIENIRSELLKELKLLIEVYNKTGDNVAADAAFHRYTDLQDVIDEEDRKNRLMSFEVEAKIAEAESTITDLVTEKKLADLTRNYLYGIAGLLLIVSGIIFGRFRVTRRQKKIIETEKQRSETLLLNILPEEIAHELKEKGKADARDYQSITILFSDFVGFTEQASKLSAAELVHEINVCFEAFDHIMDAYGIEKIKTIGDAYMAAGGLPLPGKNSAKNTVLAALEMQAFISSRKRASDTFGRLAFDMRIGIHTGPVVAGIVGVKKFQYDIWGDTVNTASRMESLSESGRVNISQSTYERIRDQPEFVFEDRGKIEVKGKGMLEMYYVQLAVPAS